MKERSLETYLVPWKLNEFCFGRSDRMRFLITYFFSWIFDNDLFLLHSIIRFSRTNDFTLTSIKYFLTLSFPSNPLLNDRSTTCMFPHMLYQRTVIRWRSITWIRLWIM